MLHWYNGTLSKLKKISVEDINQNCYGMLGDDEIIMSAYRRGKAYVIFTDQKIIVCNVRGLIGRKQDYTAIPYDKITSYSVRAKSSIDNDCQLEVSLTGLWKVRFKFTGACDIKSIVKMISFYHQK